MISINNKEFSEELLALLQKYNVSIETKVIECYVSDIKFVAYNSRTKSYSTILEVDSGELHSEHLQYTLEEYHDFHSDKKND